MLLKIFAAEKIFSKICLKAIRATFFSNMWSVIRGGKGVWGDIQQKGKFKHLVFQGNLLPQFPPLVWQPDLSITKILKRDWSVSCNDIEKSEWDYFLSKQEIYSM